MDIIQVLILGFLLLSLLLGIFLIIYLNPEQESEEDVEWSWEINDTTVEKEEETEKESGITSLLTLLQEDNVDNEDRKILNKYKYTGSPELFNLWLESKPLYEEEYNQCKTPKRICRRAVDEKYTNVIKEYTEGNKYEIFIKNFTDFEPNYVEKFKNKCSSKKTSNKYDVGIGSCSSKYSGEDLDKCLEENQEYYSCLHTELERYKL